MIPKEDHKKKEEWPEALLSWYGRHQRDLPWRHTRDPYRILVSEVMLQQTQAGRVIGYYERFLKRFPTVEDLAQTEWEDVLPYWEGLGYYSRGKRLLQTAKAVVEKYDKKFPKTTQELLALPGVGPYTASAVMSFAHGEGVPTLDTNLYRVLSRVWGRDKEEKRYLEQKAQKLYETLSSRDAVTLNQAMMDLGSQVCKPKPLCDNCPLEQKCQSAHKVLTVPKKRVKKPKADLTIAVSCLYHEGRYLVLRGEDQLCKMPSIETLNGSENSRKSLKNLLSEEYGLEPVAVRPAFQEVFSQEGGMISRYLFCRTRALKGDPREIALKNALWLSPEDLEKEVWQEEYTEVISNLKSMRI